MNLDVYDYFAFLVLAIITTVFVSLVVFLGSLPGRIAEQRKHPQAKAINAAAWISLLTLGALWPIAFVWAFLETKSNSRNDSEVNRS
ncbi:MAG: DUF3302 domain-containing protein [Pirellula sp.]